MSNDVADGTQAEEPEVLPLTTLGLIGAIARAMSEHQKAVIAPKVDSAKVPLLKGFVENKQSDLVVEVDGQRVGQYKVNLTRDKFVVDDDEAFDEFAEEQDEIDLVITRKPAWEKAILAHAQIDPKTGTIFDSRNGMVIPGLKFVPGGQPTGTVTWTWHTTKGQPLGKAALLAAYHRGDLDPLLQTTPELMAGAKPTADDA